MDTQFQITTKQADLILVPCKLNLVTFAPSNSICHRQTHWFCLKNHTYIATYLKKLMWKILLPVRFNQLL